MKNHKKTTGYKIGSHHARSSMHFQNSAIGEVVEKFTMSRSAHWIHQHRIILNLYFSVGMKNFDFSQLYQKMEDFFKLCTIILYSYPTMFNV